VTNLFTDPRYDERVVRLALGVEPLDAAGGGRLFGPLRVLVEDAPVPLDRWRSWRPGETLDTVLGGLDRHPSGRFGRVYGPRVRTGDVVLRLVEPGGRRFVPRRVGVEILAETAAGTRIFGVGLHPGAAAPLPGRATVVRGRVVSGGGPVRWVRVRAVDGLGDEVGWAHGDDRGEFVLPVVPSPDAVVQPDDPMPVELTVFATLPPPAPDPADPLRPVVDPLWDLPVEPLPGAGPGTAAGTTELPGQTDFGPFPHDLPLGRETSVQIQSP
jgi:hypothetical protein